MLESALFSWNRSVWCWFSIAENFGFALSFLFLLGKAFTFTVSWHHFHFLTSQQSWELALKAIAILKKKELEDWTKGEKGRRVKIEKRKLGRTIKCQMRRFSVVLLWRRFETSCQDQHPAEHLSESLYNMSCRHPSHHLQVLACHPRYQDLVHHMISHQSTQWRMSHGEISAHKLPQMMIRVASHEERAYHANSYMRTVWYDQTIALYGMVHMVSRQLTCPKLPQPSHITVTR